MAETIREFLVKVGFQVDSSSEQRFERSMGRATLRAELLGKAIAEAAEAVVRGATRIAAAFDDIYYASQRTQASVTNLKSLGYAVSQLGGTYQGAVQAIESFARNIRSNPGYESLVRQLGVATRENGRLRDTVTMTRELAKVLAQKPYYIQKQYFEALGLDERTFMALQSGELVGYMEEYRKKQAALGVDQEQAARTGRDLTRSWRELGLTMSTLGERLMVDVGPSIERVVRAFDEFIVKHQDKIVEAFRQLSRAAEIVAGAFIKVFEALGPLFTRLDELAKQFTGEGALTVAMTAFAAWMTLVWLPRILGAFAGISTGFAGMLLKLGISSTALMAGGALALSTSPANGGEDAEIARRRANGTWGKTPTDGTPGAPPQITDKRNWWQRIAPKWLGGQDAPTAGSTAPIQGSTFSQKAPGIMKRLMEDFGLTREQAAGVMGNLGHESGGLRVMQERNPQGGGRGGWGWAQWTGPRRRAFEAWAAERGLDPSSDEANYGFLRHELKTNHAGVISNLKRARTVEEAMIIFENGYERAGIKNYASRQRWAERAMAAPPDGSGGGSAGPSSVLDILRKAPGVPALERILGNAATSGGGSGTAGPTLLPGPTTNSTSVELNQKTEITVLGGGDPQATGAAVADQQKGVNGSLQRNMQGAVR